MTQKPNRQLFREHALRRYMEKSDNDLLPHVISPHVFWIVWMLVGLVMICGVLAWMERVPIFANSSGVVKGSEQELIVHKHEIDIVAFVPTSISMQVHVGMSAKAQFGPSSQYFDGTIITINPLVMSPNAISKQYPLLACRTVPNVLVPSISVNILVAVPPNMTIESGTLSQVQIQTGSQRVLDLLPLFHQFTGDS